VPTRASPPYQGDADADPKGGAGRTGVEPVSLVRVQGPAAPTDRATGHPEPQPGADPGWCPYKGLPVPDPGARDLAYTQGRNALASFSRFRSARHAYATTNRPVRVSPPGPDHLRSPGLEPGQSLRTTSSSSWRVYLIPPRAHGAAIRC
jgi:hypothetical protein